MTGEPREPAEAAPAETPLGSWKEIAAYLQRDVRTARRWESREGLPVHRHKHLARSSVYAYPSELEAWRAKRQPEVEIKSRWLRAMPSFAGATVLVLALLSPGSMPPGIASASDGGIVTRHVWAGGAGEMFGAPSPDGKLFTFVDFNSNNLAVREVESGKERLLTKDGKWTEPTESAYGAAWSRDGKRIAYTWEIYPHYELRVIELQNPVPRVVLKGDDIGWIVPLDWSPDGAKILAAVTRGDRRELMLISERDGSAETLRILNIAFITSAIGVFTPDGRHVIVCDSSDDRSGQRDIVSLDLDRRVVTRIVEHPADDALMGVSPDGAIVLFLSERTGSPSFWGIHIKDGKPTSEARVIKADAGRFLPLGITQAGAFLYTDVKAARDIFEVTIDPELGQLRSGPRKMIERFEGSNAGPAFSPDGRYLAYTSKRAGMLLPTNASNTLCIRDLVTGTDRELYKEFKTLGLEALGWPLWSPDGNWILVSGWNLGGQSGSYRVDVRRGEATLDVLAEKGRRWRVLGWSADMKAAYYSRHFVAEDRIELILRDFADGVARVLHTVKGSDTINISLSPDGKWLVFSNRGEHKTLQVMPASGGPVRLLHTFDPEGNSVTHAWSPDGRFIYFAREHGKPNSYELCRIPSGGGEAQRILGGVIGLRPITVHPDGRRIVYGAEDAAGRPGDVWVIENLFTKPATQP